MTSNDVSVVFSIAVIPVGITSATYDASTGVLEVTGTGMTAGDTIDPTKLSLTGQGGYSYTLTSSAVTASSSTSFSLTLNATDKFNVNGLLNKTGTSADGGTTYNLAGATNWDVTASAQADLTGNGVTVSNVQSPTINSATYDASTGVLTVNSANLVSQPGSVNDISVNKLTLTGEAGATYTLTTSDVEITSATYFSVILNATDKASINTVLNKNGTSSTGGTTYNLAAASNWNTVISVADASNGITTSNVVIPSITSASYNASSGVLVVSGTNFLRLGGLANDIVANTFSLTGQGGSTYTLTDTANVDITSGTAFSLTLSATDKNGVNAILNKDGTSSTDSTTYNLRAANHWAAGADAAIDVADTAGNGITASYVSTQLAFTTQPLGGNSGSLLPTQPILVIQDAQGNTVIGSSASVTVSIASGSGGTLGGTTTVNAVNGVATFTDLTLTGAAGTNYVLQFTSAGLTPANSNNLTVLPVVAIDPLEWGLTAGTQFRLVAVTNGTTPATSTSISDYDNFVNTQNLSQVTYNGSSFTWQAIGLTAGSNPKTDGTRYSASADSNSIYNLAGFKVSDTSSGTRFWKPNVGYNTHRSAIDWAITSSGALVQVNGFDRVWTGFDIDASQPSARNWNSSCSMFSTVYSSLGGSQNYDYWNMDFMSGCNPEPRVLYSSYGRAGASANGWAYIGDDAALTNSYRLYAISSLITVAPGVPRKPTITVASQDSAASVSFTAGYDGGQTILNYEFSTDNGSSWTALSPASTASPIAISGLTNGTSYLVTLRAVNSLGAGLPATAVSVTPKADQTITFNNPGSKFFGTSPTLSANATSTLPVRFTSTTAGICTITSGGSLTFITVGTCTINADQSGSSSFNAAPQVQQSFSVTAVVPGAPTIGTATEGNGQVSVAFTPPASTGGAAINGYTVSCTSSNLGVPGTGTGSSSPITVTGLTNGKDYTCAVTASNSAGTSTASVASNVVTPDTATSLGVTTQPVGGASGAVLASQPILAIRGASGNTLLTDNSSQVTVSIQSGGGGTLGGTTTVTAVNGVATFTDLTLTGSTGANYVLRFSSGGLAVADSTNVVVTAGTANKLDITTQPVGGTSGAVLASQPVVTIQDAQGNTVTGSSASVTVSIGSGSGGTLGGTTTISAVNGVATFSNLTLSGTVGTNYILHFASGSLTAADSANVTITAGTANQLAFTTQPGGGTAGSAWSTQPVVEIRDAQGNRITGATESVTLTITSGTGTAGAALSCTSNAVTASSGVATFSGCQIDKAGTGYTLTASSGSLTAATSSSLAIAAGTANRLAITTQPIGSTSGTTLTTQPVVTIQDAQGNTVTGSSAPVTVTIGSGSGGTLGGTTTVSAVNGVATFSNLTLSGTVGTNYVLQFTSSGLTSTNSGAVSVTAGVARQLGISAQPVGGTSGAVLASQPVVTIQDAQGNTVTGSSAPVTVTIGSGSGGTLGGTTTLSAVNGVATFSNLTLSGTVGTNYILHFSSGSLTAADSANVMITAGTASHLRVVNQPVGGVSGYILATQPVVAIQDAQNNSVIGSSAPVTVALASGSGALGGTTTVSAINGVATFSGLTLSGTAGQSYVLRFSVAGLPAEDSAPLTVSATVPGAPINVVATAGNRQVNLSWTAPPESGGMPITAYTATGTPGGSCSTTGNTGCVVTGLTNGTAYTFSVTAHNSQGDSLPSSASAPVTPLSTSAPFLSSANPNAGPQAGGTSVTLLGTNLAGATSVRFGGAAVQSYQVNGETQITAISPAHAGGDVDIEVTTPAGTARLVHGFVYEAAPAMPGAPIVAAGNQQATVSWAQVLTGGDPTGYTVTASPGGQTCHVPFPGRAFPYASCIVGGLTNGVAYTFSVTAENSLGRVTSPNSDPATPQGLANGLCGAADGVPTLVQPLGLLCSSGVAGPVTHGTGKFIWSCQGQNGGTTQQCSAPGQSSVTDQQIPSEVTLESAQTASGCAVQEARLSAPPNQGPGQGVNMPYGAVQFEMVNCQNAEVVVRLTYADIVEGMQYWKYVVNSYHNGWVQMPADQVTLKGNTVEFTVVDNGEWDNNPTLGVVSDPGGPAYDPTVLTSPGQPTGLTVTAGDRSASVSWTAPNDGGQPALYRVEALINGTSSGHYCEASYPATQCTIQGLTNGQAYTFQVTASNGAGVSAPLVSPTPIVPQPVTPPPNPIPVMDEVGLLTLASLIAILGGWHNRRRRCAK